MTNLNFVNGATVSEADVKKHWSSIVSEIKSSRKPAFVFANNEPEVVVLDFHAYQAMRDELELARREALGKEMVKDLIAIAEGEEIGLMELDGSGVFRPVKEN